MAVVQRGAGSSNNPPQSQSSGGGGSNSSSTYAKTFKQVDITQLATLKSTLPKGIDEHLDASKADEAFKFSGPPPDGYYDLKLYPNKDQIGYDYRETNPDGTGKAGTEFYKVGLECRIIDSVNGEYDNIPIYPSMLISPTTKVWRGKQISTMAALVSKCGFKIPDHADDLTIFNMFVSVLKREPILRGNKVQWEAGLRLDNRGEAIEQGVSGGKWRSLARKMEDCPVDASEPTGHKWQWNHVTPSGNTVEVTAQARVVEWGSKERKVVQAQHGELVEQVQEVEQVQQVQAQSKPNGKPRATAPLAPPVMAPAPVVEEQSQTTEDEELQELLEG